MGCTSGGEAASSTGDTGSAEVGSDPDIVCAYPILEDPAWELGDAVVYSRSERFEGDPTTVWFSEHDRTTRSASGTQVDRVRLSGHDVVREQVLPNLPGARFEPVDGSSGLALVTGVDDLPGTVMRSLDDGTTVMALSYELADDALVDVVSSVRWVCRDEWLALGGRVEECPPASPICTADP